MKTGTRMSVLQMCGIAGFVRSGDNGIMVPQDSPIKSATDFVGKRIVYPSGSSSASLMVSPRA